MMESERIGQQIKALRKQKGHTQEELANELFISQSYLRKIEQGMANPTVNMVEKITTFLEGLPERK
ncbi:HTH-type transcriptional regulator SinR (fragment) [uncultured Eubacteriales bacterium]|uniref:HTH-type transcriptional regulator SinR n=1 Tax=uncultured Eubacteriales bacterium TaxID=172733 RepID=A0A212JQK9_9FIRM